MKLTIFAATGGIGRQALEQAIAAGHDVTAVVRNPNKLSGEAVRIVAADLAAADPAVLESTAAGADAVWRRLDERRPLDWGRVAAAMRLLAVADG
jgi:putative NADH-flavin reductase